MIIEYVNSIVFIELLLKIRRIIRRSIEFINNYEFYVLQIKNIIFNI